MLQLHPGNPGHQIDLSGPGIANRQRAHAHARIGHSSALIFHHLLNRVVTQARRLFGPEVTGLPGYPVAFDLTLQLMIGAATTAMLHGEHPRIDALIDEWKTVFSTLLQGGVDG